MTQIVKRRSSKVFLFCFSCGQNTLRTRLSTREYSQLDRVGGTSLTIIQIPPAAMLSSSKLFGIEMWGDLRSLFNVDA
jgi:hypothetical protein